MVGRRPAQYGAGVYLHNVMAWLELEGRGPRGLAISPDGSQLAAAMYFSGDVTMINAKTQEATRSVALGFQLPANDVRRGEEIFHDATYCYEQWLSCATCHPDARVDGLNWDLLNDGIGTPKNTRSMLLSHKTPPVMSEAVRADMETATASGFRYIQFHQAPEADLDDVRAYLRSLTAEPSPWLVEGKLSPLALRGKTIFESEKSKCSLCHPGPLFTNLEAYNVGTQIDWTFAGSLRAVARLDYAYQDEFFTSASNDPFFAADSQSLVNARLGLSAEDRTWEATLWGRNLTDDDNINSIDGPSTFFFDTYHYSLINPRTYGLELKYNF